MRRILDDCAALSDGVELPSRLFTSLKRNLSIVKGALLLYDPARLEYAPWASCGFDQTTLHRLRISLGANETFNALANGKPLSVTDQEQRNAFQACFSSREFASVARILLCPFIFDDTLAGVLLVTDLKAELENEDQLLECLARVAETASPLVQKARGRLTKGSGAPAARPTAETPEEQISRLLVPPAAGGKRFLFATVSLSAYSERIISSHEDLEPFRLSEDMRYFMDSFLADQGMAVMLSPNLFLVCLREYPQSSIDLFVHQLGLFLGSLFETESTKEAAAGITVVKSRVWPDEGSDVRQLIAFFSS